MTSNSGIQKHLTKLLNKDVRYDGRKKDEFRDVSVETDVSANAEGSARVIIGNTEVLAGVKLSVAKPYADSPDVGMLMVNAEFSAMASREFEQGPPSVESIELSRVIDRGIREAHAVDMAKLCIEAGELVWSVSIDIITINDDGNLMDAAGLAALAALKDARLPKLEDGKVNYKERTKDKLPMLKEPIPVTVNCIGEQLFLDCTADEMPHVEARLTTAILANGTLCAMQKGGVKTLTIEQIDTMVEMAIKASKDLREKL